MSTKDKLEEIAAAIMGRLQATAEPTEALPTIGEDAPAEASTTTQSVSPLAGLDLDTAIRLRWALRDIKAKRTKLTPVSESDLNALIQKGLVELRDDGPALTALGHRVLDQ